MLILKDKVTGKYINMIENLPETVKKVDSSLAIMSPKAAVMRSVNKDIPRNDYGLPEFVYRSDLIPATIGDPKMFSAEEAQDVLSNAVIPLDYSQGFPALDTGAPFWNQLPTEPQEAYRAFIGYLDMPKSPSQRLGIKGEPHPLSGSRSESVRQIHVLSTLVGLSTDKLMTYMHEYYWNERVQSYDMFKVATHSKWKEEKLATLENDHFLMASRFLDYAQDKLTEIFNDPEEYGLKPKEVMDLMVKMIQVQRISVGAPPMGASANKGTREGEGGIPANASLEVILRTIAKNSGMFVEGEKRDDVMRFDDPDDLEKASELVIKLNPKGITTR